MNKNSLRVSYASAVHDDAEKIRINKVLDEHRTIMGREIQEFEKRVSQAFGYEFGIMVNSGSSANLIAVELLNLPEGSEVITPLLTFSTTVAPLIQKGLVPVFIDVEMSKYTINIDQLEKAITKKTKALMIPLLIGNLPDMERLKKIAKKHKLFLIADSCDTFGPKYNKKTMGDFADITTTSFYGSHIITAGGGGGMVMVHTKKLYDRARVLRGWGRSSSLFNDSESIEMRYTSKLNNIKYDAKFIFSEVGYNFLPTELSAAFGNVQLDKLSTFKKTRESNFKTFRKFLKQYEEFFILPDQNELVNTQWLAFPITIRETAPFTRLDIVRHLEENNIQTRPIFTGNILHQPGFKDIPHRISKGSLPVTDEIMEYSFLVGCHHGMQAEHQQKLQDEFTAFLSQYTSGNETKNRKKK